MKSRTDTAPRQPVAAIPPATLAALRGVVAPFVPVAYVYAGLGNWDDEEPELRRRQIVTALAQAGTPEHAVLTIAARLAAAQPAPATLALFAAADGTLLHEQRIEPIGPDDLCGFAAPAAVVPLVSWAQRHQPYVLVVTDRTGADITSWAGDDHAPRTTSITGPDDEIERNAPGGWSQPRYQRRAEDSWRHNARQVAGDVTAAVSDVQAQVLVLSGDVRAVQLLRERLPELPGIHIRAITGSRSPDGSQAARAARVCEALAGVEVEQTRELLEHFQSHLDPGRLAVESPVDVIDALAAGRVATLIVSADANTHTAWFGDQATQIYADHRTATMAGTPIRSGPLVDVAVRAALLSGAGVRIVPSDAAGAPRGGIGALCRFGAV